MEDNKELPEINDEKELPKMAEDGIHAGFPAPATGFMEKGIDLNRELIRHPSATFFGRAVGDSMIDAGVSEGDMLVIDRALEPQDGDMAVCFVDGEFTLKYLSFSDPTGSGAESGMFNHHSNAQKSDAQGARSRLSTAAKAVSYGSRADNAVVGRDHIWLVPANPAYKPIRVSMENDFTVWGVVTYVIKKTK